MTTERAPKQIHDTVVIYGGMIVSLGLSIATSIANTHILGQEEFGKFKYVQSLWLLIVCLTTFGIYFTGSHLHTKEPRNQLPKRLSALILIASALTMLATVLAGGIYLLFGFTTRISNDLWAFLYLSPLLFGLHTQSMLSELLRAGARPLLLSLNTILPQTGYLALVATLYIMNFTLSAEILLAIYLGSTVLISVIITLQFKPELKHTKSLAKEILNANSKIGGKVYFSTILTTLSANAFQIIYGLNSSFADLAAFSLALTLSAPIAFAPNAFATAKFRSFVALKAIDGRTLKTILLFTTATLITFCAAISWIVSIIYPIDFQDAVPLAIVCAVGSAVHGVGDVFNRFLLAKAATSALLTNSVILTITTLAIGTPAAIFYGATGAAIVKTCVDILYFASIYIQYKLYIGHAKAP